jgi:ketosteroid isomerase-like protein
LDLEWRLSSLNQVNTSKPKLFVMKNHLWTLSTIILLASTSCQQQIDIEKEREAIIKVLHEFEDSFAAFDMENLSEAHVQDESDTRLAGTELHQGWNEIETLLNSYIEYNKKEPFGENFRNEKENIRLKVTGNTAWAICDNIWKWEDAKGEPGGFQNIHISFLEKIDGEWKFSFNAYVASPALESTKRVKELLRALSDGWSKVFLTKDPSHLEQIWAPGFTYKRPDGSVFDKEEGIAEVNKDTDTYNETTLSDFDVQVYNDNFAVTTGKDKVTGSDSNGRKFERNFRFTNVWVRQDQVWQCVAGHASVLN